MLKGSSGSKNQHLDYDYGVVAINAQDVKYKIPVQPIVIMKNALGRESGG